MMPPACSAGKSTLVYCGIHEDASQRDGDAKVSASQN